MKVLPQKLKIPSHVQKFQCTQCAACCTSKWKIEVDDLSYEKLRNKFTQLGREQELHDNIQFHNVAPQIRFLDNGKCPYLSDNNLCLIQLEIGEEYLLDICRAYPRRILASEYAFEFSLSLTCKTAVKTLQQEPIHIIETGWPIKDESGVTFSFIPPNTIQYYSPDKLIFDDAQLPYCSLEDLLIELLQDRRHSVSQRLVAVGTCLSNMPTQKSSTYSEDIIPRFRDYQYLEPDLERHLKQLFSLSNIYLNNSASKERCQILSKILSAISSEKPNPIEIVSETVHKKVPLPSPSNYNQKLEQYYRPSCNMCEVILENYMVNFILGKSFYTKPIQLAFYRMAFAYAAITAFSLGYCILTEQPVSEDIMLQAIYDVENIFYPEWFYPYAAASQAGKNYEQIIENGLSLANV